MTLEDQVIPIAAINLGEDLDLSTAEAVFELSDPNGGMELAAWLAERVSPGTVPTEYRLSVGSMRRSTFEEAMAEKPGEQENPELPDGDIEEVV